MPRLGFRWRSSDAIVIKGETYFALTSEALMAGGELSASADFGPAWAHVVFGANGIVYFDPFRFEVEVYARSRPASPSTSGSARSRSRSRSGRASSSRVRSSTARRRSRSARSISTVEFGGDKPPEKQRFPWDDFVRKYLEEAAPGVARVVTVDPGQGERCRPGRGRAATTETGTADGSAEKPFEVLPEFEITVTTTVPCRKVLDRRHRTTHTPSQAARPRADGDRGRGDAPRAAPARRRGKDWLAGVIEHGDLIREVRNTGAFPVGVWGPPQPEDDRKVPKGDVIKAVEGVRFEARAELEDSLPKPVHYNQLDPPGPRKPLPFVSIEADAAGVPRQGG